MRLAQNWHEFMGYLDKAFPIKGGQLEIKYQDERRKKDSLDK